MGSGEGFPGNGKGFPIIDWGRRRLQANCLSTDAAPTRNRPGPSRANAVAGPLWLVPLAAALVVVEAAPIILMAASRGIWPLCNFEDFAAAYWTPLKVAYVPSYFFNQSGFYFGAVLKLVHALTDWIDGSRAVSYRHFQVFGYLTRVVYAASTLGVVAVFWRRRRDTASAVAAAALLLGLRLGAPFIVQIYDMRVGLQLSYVVVALLIGLTSLEAMGLYLAGGGLPAGLMLFCGILSGATLFEAPHYLPFFLPLLALSVAAVGSAWALAGCVGRWAAGAAVGVLGALAGLYGTDYRSALAAAFSNFRGIVVGFPQPQPGFEAFASLKFDPASTYFMIKVVLAIQLALVLAFAASIAATGRGRQAPRILRAGWILVASYAALWIVHLRVWRTHGSYTTVFSLVFFGFITAALILQNRWLARGAGDRSRTTAAAPAAAAAGFILPCGATLWQLPYLPTYSYERAAGESFRSFNAFLGRLPGPVGLAHNDSITYFPLIALCNFSQIMYHMGSTTGYSDARFSERIQADRFPRYRLMYFYRIIRAKYHWGAAHLDVAVDQGMPALDVPAELVPLSQAQVARRCPTLDAQAPTVSSDDIPSGQDPARFMAAHPGTGLRKDTFGNMHWSFLPLVDPAVRDAVLNDVWPPKWSREGRIYYLVVTTEGDYLLGLALPAHGG